MRLDYSHFLYSNCFIDYLYLQMFEKTESGESSIDSTDDKGTFDRQTNQRSSIAERRRMYEKKSQSVAEEKPISPALK